MTNNILAKTGKTAKFVGAVLVLLLGLSMIFTAIFGVNFTTTLKDHKTIAVTMNSVVYKQKIEEVEQICKKEFDKADLKIVNTYYSEMGGDESEIVYVFKSNLKNGEAIEKVKANLISIFDDKTDEGGAWNGWDIDVTSASERAISALPCSYVLRTGIAIVIMSVLAFAYLTVRYTIWTGLVAGVSSIVTAIFATAVVLLVRIPVTGAILYTVSFASIMALVFATLFFNRVNNGIKKGKDTQNAVAENGADKEMMKIAGTLCVALLLVGIIANTAMRWFAFASIVALGVSTAIAVFIMPATYLWLQLKADERRANNPKYGYVGAKKKEENE